VAEQEPTRRGWKLTLTLIGSTIVCVTGFPILLLALAMAPMLFDAPGSYGRPLPWLMLALVVATPVACLVGTTGGWMSYILRRVRAAWTFALIPLPLLLIYLLTFGAPLFENRGPVFSGPAAASAAR